MIAPFLTAFLRRCAWPAAFGLLLTGPAASAQTWQSVAALPSLLADVRATATDTEGDVYLTGGFSGTITLGSLSLTSAGGTDVFVAKWNRTQGFVWAQRAGGPGTDVATALAVAGSNVYIGGTFAGATAAFGTTALSNAGPAGTTDAFVARFTNEGAAASLGWAQRAGGPDNDELTALAATGAGVYAAGSYRGTARFGPATLTSTGSSTPDVFVTKLTDVAGLGNFIWTQSTSGVGAEQATAIGVQGSSVYVAGSFSGTGSFGSTLLASAGSLDVFITRLTDAGTTGSFVWAQRAGGSNDDMATSLAVNGNAVYLAGSFASFAATFTPVILANNGNADVFVAKLLDAGSTAPGFAWAQRAGGTEFDSATGLAVRGNSVYIAGQFNSAQAGFGAAGALSNPTSPFFDLFVAKLTDAGTSASFGWAQQAGGLTHDYAYGLSVSGSRLYVVGSATPPAQFGPLALPGVAGTPVGYLAAITDNVATATQSPALLAGLSVYPNPAHHSATVRVPAVAGAAPSTLTLIDGLGRVVRTQELSASAGRAAEIPLAGLPTGLYQVRVQVGTERATRSLLVE